MSSLHPMFAQLIKPITPKDTRPVEICTCCGRYVPGGECILKEDRKYWEHKEVVDAEREEEDEMTRAYAAGWGE